MGRLNDKSQIHCIRFHDTPIWHEIPSHFGYAHPNKQAHDLAGGREFAILQKKACQIVVIRLYPNKIWRRHASWQTG
jgi:hypothetical protein